MTRTALPFSAPDLSAFARALRKSLLEHHAAHGEPPGHVALMNMMARGIGVRSLQALKAGAQLPPRPAASPPPTVTTASSPPAPQAGDAEAAALSDTARKALRQFDADGKLVRWPTRLGVQRLALWILWTRFDRARVYDEPEVNAILRAWHHFGDHATLRRELVNHGLMTRKSDCSEYRKARVQPDGEVRALLGALRRGSQ